MVERPILFSAPMVRATLAGAKTQTRRIAKGEPFRECHGINVVMPCPCGAPGDRLWVKERHQALWETDTCPPTSFREGGPEWRVHYVADGGPMELHDMNHKSGDERLTTRSRPSIFLPRWASRITLEVTEVRVQRLQEITEEDAKAEGVTLGEPVPAIITRGNLDGTKTSERGTVWDFTHRGAFCRLWDSINGADGKRWVDNPWIWVVGFRPLATDGAL